MKADTAYRVARGLGWFSLGLGLAEVLAPRALAKFLGARGDETWLRSFGFREIAAGAGILSGKHTTLWMWSRVAGDAMDLAGLAALAASPKAKEGNVLASLGTVAAITALDVWTAVTLSGGDRVELEKRITIGQPADALYDLWRSPVNLARIMSHVAEIDPVEPGVTRWTLKAAPLLRWEAKIVEERRGEFIAWKSTEGSVHSEGSITFRPAPGEWGTEVALTNRFSMPGQALGNAATELFRAVPEALTLRALRRFKSLAETGEIPTLEHNPTARPEPVANLF